MHLGKVSTTSALHPTKNKAAPNHDDADDINFYEIL